VGALARRLVDAGLAHPLPPEASAPRIAVVVPTYDAAPALGRCLRALAGLPVTVVDDGSSDAEATAAVARQHGARLIRLPTNAGPAAARNAGAAATESDVVAFVDADVAVTASALRRLAHHFADPAVAAAAPRVRPAWLDGGALARFSATWSPLDLGGDPSPVGPGRTVPYVPSAVLLVRREALAGRFDGALWHGEDVDLVWRIVEQGGQVRYEPTVIARHAEPTSWGRWLHRRFRYGTSAAPLHARHPAAMAPLHLQPGPTAVVVLAACGRKRLAAAALAAVVLRVEWRLRRSDVVATQGVAGTLAAPFATWLGLSRWSTQLAWPVLLLCAISRRRRNLALASALAPPVVEWVTRRPRLDVARWTIAFWADDVAYGLGVWRGCLRARTLRPLLPRLVRR
jgi:mycofactocin system glycosyltransferase